MELFQQQDRAIRCPSPGLALTALAMIFLLEHSATAMKSLGHPGYGSVRTELCTLPVQLVFPLHMRAIHRVERR